MPFTFLTEAAPQGNSSFLIMLILMFALMYFLMIRPENKKRKKAEEMRSSIVTGDEITTIGGITGKVVAVTENAITFETGEDRVRIQVKKWAICTSGSCRGRGCQEQGRSFPQKVISLLLCLQSE